MSPKPKKSLGQNFLLDKNIIEKIIDSAKIKSSDIVLEIGPGTGNLTKFIVARNPKKIYLIEKDETLANALEKQYLNKVNIIKKDILEIPYEFYSEKRFLILGNLPYNISTKILSEWCVNKNLNVSKMILMFQKEVAERIIANHNNKKYGRLSVLVQSRCKVSKLFNAPSSIFSPRPKVDGIVMQFNPINDYSKINYIKLGNLLEK